MQGVLLGNRLGRGNGWSWMRPPGWDATLMQRDKKWEVRLGGSALDIVQPKEGSERPSEKSPVSQEQAYLGIPAPHKAASGKHDLMAHMTMDFRAAGVTVYYTPYSWRLTTLVFVSFQKFFWKRELRLMMEVKKKKVFVRFIGKILNVFLGHGILSEFDFRCDSIPRKIYINKGASGLA